MEDLPIIEICSTNKRKEQFQLLSSDTISISSSTGAQGLIDNLFSASWEVLLGSAVGNKNISSQTLLQSASRKEMI